MKSILETVVNVWVKVEPTEGCRVVVVHKADITCKVNSCVLLDRLVCVVGSTASASCVPQISGSTAGVLYVGSLDTLRYDSSCKFTVVIVSLFLA